MGAFRCHLSNKSPVWRDTGLIASRYHLTMQVAVRIPKFWVDVKPVVWFIYIYESAGCPRLWDGMGSERNFRRMRRCFCICMRTFEGMSSF